MKYKRVVAGGLLLSLSGHAAPVIIETTSASGLKHPGCLQSAAEINALATALGENNSIRKGYWNSMMSNGRGRIDKADWIPPTDLFGGNFARSAKYAGAGLIRYANDWIINGTPSSEAAAIKMLNTWAGVQSWSPDPSDGYRHHRLSSMWFGYLAHAGDLLISSNTTWPVDEQNAFKDTVRNIFLPIANNDRATGFNGNWDLGATWAVMSMAVLLDDKALFDEQIAWLKDGETNARISYYLLASGQNQESARDQGHSRMGLEFLSLAAQTAWTQGIDLYEFDNRSVAKAFEYNAAYNQGEDDLSFQVYPCAVGSNSAHDTNTVISTIGRPVYPGMHEMVYHHYKNYRGIELPHVKSMMENHTRPEKPNGNGSNHNTALYWDLDLSADAALRQAQCADATLDINPHYAGRATLRLNCGGAHYSATDGRAFTKEKRQWNDGGVNESHSSPVVNTREEALYQTYRRGNVGDSIYYHFGLPDGEYRVKLHFAEPTHTQNNSRIFNVYIEGTQSLTNVDIYAVAGSNSATIHEMTVALTGGQLDVQLESITDEGIISAIEIEPLLPDTIDRDSLSHAQEPESLQSDLKSK